LDRSFNYFMKNRVLILGLEVKNDTLIFQSLLEEVHLPPASINARRTGD